MADAVVLDLEEGIGDSEANTSLCLMGRLLNPKPFNLGAMTNIINKAWKTRVPVRITPWGSNNTFLFKFDSVEDKLHILKDGPWSIMNNLLVLKGLEDGMIVSEIDFSRCPIWVQIHGLPVDKMSCSNAEIIGRRFGKLLAIEVTGEGLLINRSFLRIKVEIDTNIPLPKGFWLRRNGVSNPDIWVSYKYEKLPDFCYWCGRIGHDNRVCRFVTKEEGSTSGYGPDLRTGRARKSDAQVMEIPEVVTTQEEAGAGHSTTVHGLDRVARVVANFPQHVDVHPPLRFSPTSEGVRSTRSAITQGTDGFIPKGTGVFCPADDSLCEVLVQCHDNHWSSEVTRIPVDVISLGNGAQHGYQAPKGIGRTVTSQALGELVRKNRPSIVFLMETKNNKVKVETIRRSLKFDFGFYVEPDGLSGGLALWWNDDVDLEVESASKNLIHSIVKDKSSSSCWATTFVYGSPLRSGRDMVWEDMKDIGRYENLPWLSIGDFNEVLSLEDKLGGNCPSQRRLASFHDMLNYCGLLDLDYKGPKFTWRNNRSGPDCIMERIDMAFANSRWRELFDQALVLVDTAIGSDHNPLILNTQAPLNIVGKSFKFESLWTTEDECREIIQEVWGNNGVGSCMVNFCKKLRGCKVKLKEWHRAKFGDLRFQIAVTKDKLLEVQKQLDEGFNPDLIVAEQELK
ncbi:hypothetical protein Vadar_007269 [Vaccinium darrowii]|uniref:Uncharacterized protein n=1 Tax=Vaccinium darrowii TaxID=229202 RepID=A0ACB7YDA6_9ERIC|nr:hypothetical protein Vadar_007269 [Vaccinium darrowii]